MPIDVLVPVIAIVAVFVFFMAVLAYADVTSGPR